MSVVVGPLLTAAEYLAIERAAESRSEFHDGVMYAMAGGTHRHSRLKSSCMVALGLRLRGKKCQPTDSDMRVLVPATGLYTYPVSVSFAVRQNLRTSSRIASSIPP